MTSSLIELYNEPAANRVSGFCSFAEHLDVTVVFDGYAELLQNAPRRHERGKSYLGGRTGVTGSGSYSDRREEHLAVALYNASRGQVPFALPDGRTLAFLDYQTPLKARRDDSGIGKVDLFGAIDGTLPCVVELKVAGSKGALADTPLRALLEGLTYCAIVEANGEEIAREALDLFGCRFETRRPALVVAAPEDYWLGYFKHPRSGDWLPVLDILMHNLCAALDLEIHLVALADAGFTMGLSREPPRLTGRCRMTAVTDLA